MLTLEQQAAFVEEAPEIFLPIPGGWGKKGHTLIRLVAASEDVLTDENRKLRVGALGRWQTMLRNFVSRLPAGARTLVSSESR